MGSRRPRRNNNNKKPPSWAFYLIYENSHKISWKHFRPLFCYIIILKICANIFLTWNPLNYQRNRVKSIFELVLAPRWPVWSDKKMSFVSGLALMSVIQKNPPFLFVYFFLKCWESLSNCLAQGGWSVTSLLRPCQGLCLKLSQYWVSNSLSIS